MNLKIGSIALERFRAFQHLKIQGFGRVNLITGKNNTGKSSILEALRILTSDAAPSVIHDILHYREEDISESRDRVAAADVEALFQVSALFCGFPELSSGFDPIVIATNGG